MGRHCAAARSAACGRGTAGGAAGGDRPAAEGHRQHLRRHLHARQRRPLPAGEPAVRAVVRDPAAGHRGADRPRPVPQGDGRRLPRQRPQGVVAGRADPDGGAGPAPRRRPHLHHRQVPDPGSGRPPLRDLRHLHRHHPDQARRGAGAAPERRAGGPGPGAHRGAGGHGPRAGRLRLLGVARPARAAARRHRVQRDAARGAQRTARRGRPGLSGPRPGRDRAHGPADRRPAEPLAHRTCRAVSRAPSI